MPAVPVVPAVKKGLGTWLGVISSVALILKPAVEQVIGLIENTSIHMSGGEKISVISGAAVAGITILSRAGQAVAHIIGAAIKGEAPPSV